MEKNNKKEFVLEYDMMFVNVLSIVIMIICGLVTVLILKLGNFNLEEILILEDESKFWFMYMVFFGVLILWMVLHEIIHYVAYQVGGAKGENLVFGVSLENGVFYCKCKEYISKKCIMLSLLSPFILIGIVTYIIGFLIKSPSLVLLSIFNISGASGDLMMFFFFLKQKDDIEFKELGFSSPFCLRTSDDLINKKFLGIKTIREPKSEAEINEGKEKKITISKFSMGCLVVFVLLFVFSLVMLFR